MSGSPGASTPRTVHVDAPASAAVHLVIHPSICFSHACAQVLFSCRSHAEHLFSVSLQGMYYGGVPQALALVRAGLAAPEDFRVLLGLSAWAPGQLEAEVGRAAGTSRRRRRRCCCRRAGARATATACGRTCCG